MTDADLIALLTRAADALDEEAAYLVDVDHDDRGRQLPSIPDRDRDYFDAVTDEARRLRELAATVAARTNAIPY